MHRVPWQPVGRLKTRRARDQSKWDGYSVDERVLITALPDRLVSGSHRVVLCEWLRNMVLRNCFVVAGSESCS